MIVLNEYLQSVFIFFFGSISLSILVNEMTKWSMVPVFVLNEVLALRSLDVKECKSGNGGYYSY